jgi:hypothetical protein
MQNDTAQLLASIDSSIQGVLFRTKGDYALKPWVWDTSTQGEFNISRLLKSTGNLVAIELDDFLSWGERLEDCERGIIENVARSQKATIHNRHFTAPIL